LRPAARSSRRASASRRSACGSGVSSGRSPGKRTPAAKAKRPAGRRKKRGQGGAGLLGERQIERRGGEGTVRDQDRAERPPVAADLHRERPLEGALSDRAALSEEMPDPLRMGPRTHADDRSLRDEDHAAHAGGAQEERAGRAGEREQLA